jgi:hypothetical protein
LEAFAALYARPRVVPHRVSELLNTIAYRTESLQAKRLAALYQTNLRTVGADANLASQALYAALVGRFGDQATPEPDFDEVKRLIAGARKNLASNPRVENWALDGVHTGRFKDGRFAGTCVMMAACCRAYEHFGRLVVEDRWPSSFREST